MPRYRGPFVQWLDPPRVAIVVAVADFDSVVVDSVVVAVIVDSVALPS